MKQTENSEEIKKKLINSLRNKGYKLTRQRIEIIDLLSTETIHPSAMDIFNKVRKRVPQVSMSTVYYTLGILKKEGLIRELEFCDRDNRYDVNVSNHLNLICTKCGKIEDFKVALPVLSQAVEKKTGFRSVQMRFEYHGYCKKCRPKKNS
jgi:Fe2+ or Zn2+ uptake regulation protein